MNKWNQTTQWSNENRQHNNQTKHRQQTPWPNEKCITQWPNKNRQHYDQQENRKHYVPNLYKLSYRNLFFSFCSSSKYAGLINISIIKYQNCVGLFKNIFWWKKKTFGPPLFENSGLMYNFSFNFGRILFYTRSISLYFFSFFSF